jgi:hypothetical protein
MALMQTLDALRVDLATRSQWNIGYLAAGAVYWSFVTIISATQPIDSARIYWAVGGCLIFPAAIVLSLLWGADPFVKQNTLGNLIGLSHASVIWLLMPLIVVLFMRFPAGLLLAAAICLCVSYPVLSWAFGAPLFLWHAIIRVIGVTIIWFALPRSRDVVLPAFVAGIYLLTTALLPSQRRAWLHAHTPVEKATGL